MDRFKPINPRPSTRGLPGGKEFMATFYGIMTLNVIFILFGLFADLLKHGDLYNNLLDLQHLCMYDSLRLLW